MLAFYALYIGIYARVLYALQLDDDLLLLVTRSEKDIFACFSDALPDRRERTLLNRGEQIAASEEKRPVRRLASFDYLMGIEDESRMAGFRLAETADVMVHSPAYGILDLDDSIDGEFIHYGEEEILSRVMSVHPRAHLFGHIHRRHEVTGKDGIIFSNQAILNEDYSKLNIPIIIKM